MLFSEINRPRVPLSKRTPVHQRHGSTQAPSGDLSFLDGASFSELPPALLPFQSHYPETGITSQLEDPSMLSLGNISDADISMITSSHGHLDNSNYKNSNFNSNIGSEGALKEQERVLDASKKEIFDLKLKIFHLEERLHRAISPQAEASLIEAAELKTLLAAREQALVTSFKDLQELQKRVETLEAARDAALATLEAERVKAQSKLEEHQRAASVQLAQLASGKTAELTKKATETSIILKEAEHRRFMLEAELEELALKASSERSRIVSLEEALKERTNQNQSQEAKISHLYNLIQDKEAQIRQLSESQSALEQRGLFENSSLKSALEVSQEALRVKETDEKMAQRDTQKQLENLQKELESTRNALSESREETRKAFEASEARIKHDSLEASNALVIASERIRMLEAKLSLAQSTEVMEANKNDASLAQAEAKIQALTQERDHVRATCDLIQSQFSSLKEQSEEIARERLSLLQGVEGGRMALAGAFEAERERLLQRCAAETHTARAQVELAAKAQAQAEKIATELTSKLGESERKRLAAEAEHERKRISMETASVQAQFGSNDAIKRSALLERQLAEATRALGESARALADRERMREEAVRGRDSAQAETIRFREELGRLREEASKALQIYSQERSSNQLAFKTVVEERDSLLREINTIRADFRGLTDGGRLKIETLQAENASLARSKAELDAEKARLQSGFSSQLTKTMEKLRDTELELLRQRSTIENYEHTLSHERERFSKELHSLKLAAAMATNPGSAISDPKGSGGEELILLPGYRGSGQGALLEALAVNLAERLSRAGLVSQASPHLPDSDSNANISTKDFDPKYHEHLQVRGIFLIFSTSCKSPEEKILNY